MTCNSFYARPRQPARIVTYVEAIEVAVESAAHATIVVLPPENGDDPDGESDLEDVPNDLDNEEPFEPAGEFEVEHSDDSETDGDDDGAEPAAKWARAGAEKSWWKKKDAYNTLLELEQLL